MPSMLQEKTHATKEDHVLRRRFSLCTGLATPQKIDPRKLIRNSSFGGYNEICPLTPGTEMEKNGFSALTDEVTSTPISSSKVQKKNYRQEKKRASKEMLSALKDPTVVAMEDWLKIRGTLKSWTKFWCVLKPGVLLIYKTPNNGQWVGTILLNTCELIERPSKKDGFCFKLFHPLDQSIWAVKGPKGENVGSITQPLPSSYLIFRAASESDGRCWMDALELALRCSSLLKRSTVKDGDLNCSMDATHPGMCSLQRGFSPTHQEIFHDAEFANHVQYKDADMYSDRSDRENDPHHEELENDTNEKSSRSEESDTDLSEIHGEMCRKDLSEATYVAENSEEFGEIGETTQTETVSEENKSLMWTVLKQLRPGMDLSRVVLPTFILEPRSFLDKLSDYYYHSDLLSQAALEENAYGRMKQVLRWYLSGFYKKPKGLKKPYNPILGETFRCYWYHPKTDSRTFYIAEQVSHHPPVSAFYVSNRKDNFCISGSILARSKFYGNSMSAILDGKARLWFLNRQEDYIITMPYAHCKGLLYGTLTLEMGGKITIECEKTHYKAELEFKLKPFLGGSDTVNQITGKIMLGEEVQATLEGHWDRDVCIHEKKTGFSVMFWSVTNEIRKQRLIRHVVWLEEQDNFESERLWQQVTRAIKNRDQEQATLEKFILEEAQRKAAKERNEKHEDWVARLFQQDVVTKNWQYKFADTSPWDSTNDIIQFEKDGIIQTNVQHKFPTTKPMDIVSNSNQIRQQVSVQGCIGCKTSDHPAPNRSQNTESSCSTPEPVQDDSSDEGLLCPRCKKGTNELTDIHTAIQSIQRTQQEIHRNLAVLKQQACHKQHISRTRLLNPHYWLVICVLLLFQLIINYFYD
ncbi:oxysterol-binding protein-related protein 5 isoform X3 [Carcharodon carcharias]|uniref:oxysterol-binding protein-related protein 5 isoform X3 n=1 Tax=Carcharodon carcharias TaxID=13397 RepID=UPI001B7E1128|nr:oxysterol-binding protein-related protein 5 isoform X3 [Carcharodon carcharias]